MLKVGILISGRGSNMQALIAACATPDFPAEITCVISNRADAPGIEFAKASKIPTHVIAHKDFPDRQKFEEKLSAVLEEHKVQLICLAGFMRLLTGWFTERWRDRMINIHPSLLPAFPGLDTHKAVLDYGAKLAGCTVHFVRTEMDHGPIIMQAAVPVSPMDTEHTLAARILEAEHKAYPAALRMIAENRVNVIDEKVFVTDAAEPGLPYYNPKP